MILTVYHRHLGAVSIEVTLNEMISITFLLLVSLVRSQCNMGEDCGGQEWNECGTPCPLVCGEDPPECMGSCEVGYQCPYGQAFNSYSGACEDAACATSDWTYSGKH